MPKRGHQPRGLLVTDAGEFVVTASATSAVQGATVTIFAQFATSDGSPVAEAGKVVTWGKTGTGGSFNNATSSTNINGVAQVTLTVGTIVGGTYTVTAQGTNGVTGTSPTITVTADLVPASLTLTPTTLSLAPLATSTLTVVVKNAIGTVLSSTGVAWFSSSESAATVAAGIVTAVAAGLTNITASKNGIVSNAVAITVTANVTPASIVVSPTTLSIASGTSTLSAVVKNAAGGAITGLQPTAWHSSNTAVVTVSSTGVVTYVGDGSANITATIDAITSNTCVVTALAIGGGGGTNLARHDFEDGTLGPFTDPFGHGRWDVVADPTARATGKVARVHYIVNGSTQVDDNEALIPTSPFIIAPGEHLWFHGDLYLPAGDDLTAFRKLIRFGWNGYEPHPYELILTQQPTGQMQTNIRPLQAVDSGTFGYSSFYLSTATWYRVKVHVRLESNLGAADGIVEVWFDSTKIYDNQAVSWATVGTWSQAEFDAYFAFRTFGVGQQLDKSGTALDEYRLWDNVSFATTEAAL